MRKGNLRTKILVDTDKKKSVVAGVKSKKRRSSNTSILCWFLFFCSIAVWGYVFGTSFSNFEREVKVVDSQFTLMSELAGWNDEVLGIADEIGTADGENVDAGSETDVADINETIAEQLEEAEDTASDEEVASVVDQIEEERKEKLREVLLLQLPKETDNPNYPMTFVNPTEKGVEIQVDGNGFAVAMSPYVLPALSIGEHTINFRFDDTDGVMQNLEETVIVIPRAPVWSEDQHAEFRSDADIVFTGTALPNSRVVLLVSSTLISQVGDADNDGNWSIVLDAELGSGEHTAVAFVRKSGFASDFSEPLSFTVGYVEGATAEDGNGNESDKEESEYLFGIIPYTEDNYYFVLGGAGVVIVALVLVLIAIVRAIARSGRKEDNWIERAREKRSSEETVSLREKFEQAGIGIGSEKKSKKLDKKDTQEDEPEKKADIESKKTHDTKEDTVDEKIKDESKDSDKNDDKHDGEPEEIDKASIEDEKPEETTEDFQHDSPAEEKKPEPPVEIEPGKVYSKDEFLKKFENAETTSHKETNKLRISLTSQKGK